MGFIKVFKYERAYCVELCLGDNEKSYHLVQFFLSISESLNTEIEDLKGKI